MPQMKTGKRVNVQVYYLDCPLNGRTMVQRAV